MFTSSCFELPVADPLSPPRLGFLTPASRPWQHSCQVKVTSRWPWKNGKIEPNRRFRMISISLTSCCFPPNFWTSWALGLFHVSSPTVPLLRSANIKSSGFTGVSLPMIAGESRCSWDLDLRRKKIQEKVRPHLPSIKLPSGELT